MPTSCRNDVITPNVMVPLRRLMPPQTKASRYPNPKAQPMMSRVMTVNRVRRTTLPCSRCCIASSRSVTHCSEPSERSTALCSMPSCTCICMRLSSCRMSSVIWRSRRAISLPKMMASGVSNSSAHASRASNHRISMNAPHSCITVMAICGMVSVQMVLTCSMSLASRDVTSPECSSCSSNSWRRNRLLNIRSRSQLVCRTSAVVVSQ